MANEQSSDHIGDVNEMVEQPFELTPGPPVSIPPEKPLYIRVTCEGCGGTGYDPDEEDEKCWDCNGYGYDEPLALEYTETMGGLNDWVYSDEPDASTVLVTREGLRRLLRAAGDDRWQLATSLMLIQAGREKDAREMYPDVFTTKGIARMMNESSKISCEGEIVVSGLFVGDDGKPIINPCAE